MFGLAAIMFCAFFCAFSIISLISSTLFLFTLRKLKLMSKNETQHFVVKIYLLITVTKFSAMIQ